MLMPMLSEACDVVPSDRERLAQRCEDRLDDRFGVSRAVQIAREDGELVAGQAPEHVVAPQQARSRCDNTRSSSSPA